jgi:alkylation response protein AidB-like acyl-CoA dehydrogenase
MDFGFTEVQQELRGLAATILLDEVTRDRLKELEAGGERIDRRVWQAFAEANLLGLVLPEQDGGSGLGIMELCVLLEEVGRRVAPIPLLATVAMGAMPVARFGTPEQRRRLLPPVIAGQSFLSAALQEPASHDPLSVATTARREGTGWMIDGDKIGVPWGSLADHILVSAQTGEGTTGMFIVDPAGAGVTRQRAEATNREPQASLLMEGARVSDDDVLGDPFGGAEVVGWTYHHALAGLCATAVGVFDEALRITAAYLSEREQFGRPLATFQGASLRAADAYIDTEATRVATWSAIWRLAEGHPAEEALAIAKFWVADGGQRIAHACQHLHGGMGVDIDYPIHRYFLWAKELELTLGGATPQLLRLGDALASR